MSDLLHAVLAAELLEVFHEFLFRRASGSDQFLHLFSSGAKSFQIRLAWFRLVGRNMPIVAPCRVASGRDVA
jgi:hypothetical protein